MTAATTVPQTLTDQTIASDMLIAAKAAIKDYSAALAETATPQVRTVLKKQLDSAIMAHEQITNFMMAKGWYQPYNIKQQIQQDIQNAQTALSIQA